MEEGREGGSLCLGLSVHSEWIGGLFSAWSSGIWVLVGIPASDCNHLEPAHHIINPTSTSAGPNCCQDSPPLVTMELIKVMFHDRSELYKRCTMQLQTEL